ncbi:MAG: hypothetical protein ACLTMP_06635 [Eggerthella lenta]
MSRTIMLLALACYAIGYGLLDLWSFGALDGSVVEAGSGLMMGFGAAVMCLVWMSRLHVLEFRRALVVAWVAGCVLFASASLLPMLGATPARTVLTVAAALSVVGCARLFFRSEGEDERSAQAGVNWWDVFGHLDVSVVEGTGDFKPHSLARCSSPLCRSPCCCCSWLTIAWCEPWIGCRSAGFGGRAGRGGHGAPHSHEDRSGAHQLLVPFLPAAGGASRCSRRRSSNLRCNAR